MILKLRRQLKRLFVYLLPFYQQVYIRILRHKKQINVVFFAMTLPMWRYQHLYELMKQNPRFNVKIVIAPCCAYSLTQQQKDVNLLQKYFDECGIEYVLGCTSDGKYLDIRKILNPHILFYPQPYGEFYRKELLFSSFYDRLLCYCPYAFWSSNGTWSYNQPLHQTAWKLFYSTELHKRDAEIYSLRKSKNVEVVGYPTADDFLRGDFIDPWKSQDIKKKRVIWAPHFSISDGGYLYQSNFLILADQMLNIAKRYSDSIQFVFKPHPRLFTELCHHEEWGEEKAVAYYQLWDSMENTQIETGPFIDLFMTSDAMIHDCGSFSVEYHYTENPVMYVAQNFKEQIMEKNELGKLAMYQHYVGKTIEDIVSFIDNVIIGGNDPMKLGRKQFKDEYLVPPNGKSVAENMMDILLKALM